VRQSSWNTQVNQGREIHGGKIRLIRGSKARHSQNERRLPRVARDSAKATLKQGVREKPYARKVLKSPVIDVTDHSAGKNPYYAP